MVFELSLIAIKRCPVSVKLRPNASKHSLSAMWCFWIVIKLSLSSWSLLSNVCYRCQLLTVSLLSASPLSLHIRRIATVTHQQRWFRYLEHKSSVFECTSKDRLPFHVNTTYGQTCLLAFENNVSSAKWLCYETNATTEEYSTPKTRRRGKAGVQGGVLWKNIQQEYSHLPHSERKQVVALVLRRCRGSRGQLSLQIKGTKLSLHKNPQLSLLRPNLRTTKVALRKMFRSTGESASNGRVWF